MDMTIRRIHQADYADLAELEGSLLQRPVSVDEVRGWVETPGRLWVVAERNGRLVGRVRTSAPAAAGMPPDDVPCHVYVRPEERRQGVGTALWQGFHEAVQELRPTHLRGFGSADSPEAAGWAVRQGFRVTHTLVTQALDLTHFGSARWATCIRQAEANGFRFVPFPETGAPTSRMHELFSQFLMQTPDADEHGPVPYSDWREAFELSPDGWPQGWMAGLAPDGEWFGMTMVQRRGPTHGHVVITGVLAPYRGRGLSLALKAASTQHVMALGISRLTTTNHAGNEPILAANRQLGFVPVSRTQSLVLPYA
jgi:GNAT superfamily N-acetyltransferase